MTRKSVGLVLGLALIATVGSQALAGTTFDQSLVSPSTNAGDPGWYDGTGNPNGGFTVTNNSNIELGLRAKYRHNPAVIDSPNNNYSVVAGPETQTTSGNNGTSANAAWNYEFSIDLRPHGVGTLTLGDIIAQLTVSDNAGHSVVVNPLTYWSDDAGWGSAGKTAGVTSGLWGAQNSENPKFGDFPLAAFYNINQDATYTFKLDVYQGSLTNLLASDSINVVVGSGIPPVPLPASVWSGSTALAGLGFAAFMKRRRALKSA
jgi:hypothetical protein